MQGVEADVGGEPVGYIIDIDAKGALKSNGTKMIVTQRAYSANSKTITTTDEMMQEALSLKR